MLQKGDPCYVRHQGLIKKAIYYDCVPSVKKSHYVFTENGEKVDEVLIATIKPIDDDNCRFVCMTGLNNAQQQSLGLKVKER